MAQPPFSGRGAPLFVEIATYVVRGSATSKSERGHYIKSPHPMLGQILNSFGRQLHLEVAVVVLFCIVILSREHSLYSS